MKILQINNVYDVGSTGKLTSALHTGLQMDGYASVVLYGRGPDSDETDVYRLCNNLYGKLNHLRGNLLGAPYGGCILSTRKAIAMICREKPDVVHLQCLNGYFINIYKLIAWLRDHRIPTVLTLHAEFMYTGNCGHSLDCERWKASCGHCAVFRKATGNYFFDRTRSNHRKMQKAFSTFNKNLIVVSVSPWLERRAKMSSILGSKEHSVIFNGVDTSIFCRRNIPDLRDKYHTQYRNIIFHATAMFRDDEDDLKGGWYVLQLARRMPSVLVIVAGKYQLSTDDLPENLILLGEIQNQRLLADYYTLADLTLITSKRETYSMVCAESLCCGTPVVGFCAGAPEMISLPNYSEFISQRSEYLLEQCIQRWLTKRESLSSEEIKACAHKVYDISRMVREYENIYRRALCD